MKRGLDIIIVNWNSGEHLFRCINSIGSARKDNFNLNRIVIIDNASVDDSLKQINYDILSIKLVRNPFNIGFAKACNQGAKYGDSEYILFLNPDVRLYEDSLDKPIEFMEREENKSIGIVGIQLVDDKGEVAKSCAKFPTFWMFLTKILGLHHLFPPGLFPIYYMYENDFSHSQFVDQVSGAFFLVRKSLFKELGGFDERFFVYFEDLDFSLMARKIGYMSYYLASVKAYHKGGGTTEQAKGITLFYYLKSEILYYYKHFNLFLASTLTFLTLIVELVTRVIFSFIYKHSIYKTKDVLRAYFLLWRSVLTFSLAKKD
jgi:N-acetylglucosaminyl-diphospho-decaprenol L-rhamnosyltransferase